MGFRLAPMTTGLAVLTWALFALPLIFFYAASISPSPVHHVMFGSAIFIVVLYASVWFAWRPTRFEIDDRALRIVWPIRVREIDRADVEDARIVSADEFRREYGLGMRIGAGGLWGGFGLLKTAKATFSMWISRTDRFVIVRLQRARPLLVTPEDPERFVKALRVARPGW